VSDFHLNQLGRKEFLRAVKKAMLSHGKAEWLRLYEGKFGWPRRGFTWQEYRRWKSSRKKPSTCSS